MNQEVQFITEAQSDNQWLQSHYKEIQEEYPNKFVAIVNKKIITAGEKMENVVKDLKEIGKDPAMVLIEFIPEKGLILIL
jgi:orotate phosphoribosyltransferase-like protein